MKYVTAVPQEMPVRARAVLRPDNFEELGKVEQFQINTTLGLLDWNESWEDIEDSLQDEEMPYYEVWICIIGSNNEYRFKVHPGKDLDWIFEEQDHDDLTWFEYIRPVEVDGDELEFELDGRYHMLAAQVEYFRQSDRCPMFVRYADDGDLTYKVEWRLPS